MDESMGPCEKGCPVRLIKLASPFRDTYQGYARQWRDDCLNAGAKQREAKAQAPKVGERFRTLRPVRFSDGREFSEFVAVSYSRRGKDRKAYQPIGSGGLYRFNPVNYGFERI